MKRSFRAVMLSLLVFSLLLALFVNSAPLQAAEYPNVANLRPFSPEANYMSLPGYLRFLVFEQDGIWLSRAECAAIVRSQISAERD
ncbi:MAG: hypothetical protein HYU64_15545 [Armatimonadetes bacterium]|nr:hypothetical protein [Armatimonadota bacterium]